ncbi:hypothetical protein EDB83DRAFT_1585605 [Lactarius deliciosus]|nr:hypothetical protein EDB83DRAFT_1585605 [Lactarius deliciosus]
MRDRSGHMIPSPLRGAQCDKFRRAMDAIVHRRAVLQTAHTHGPPTYASPRLLASSSFPTVRCVQGPPRSVVIGGVEPPARVELSPDDGCARGARAAAEEHGSSAKDSPSSTVPNGSGAEVDHPGVYETLVRVPSLVVSGLRRERLWGRATKGGRLRSCGRVAYEVMTVSPWPKRLRCSVMRDIIATVTLWEVGMSKMGREDGDLAYHNSSLEAQGTTHELDR